jgi:hypothetical protein
VLAGGCLQVLHIAAFCCCFCSWPCRETMGRIWFRNFTGPLGPPHLGATGAAMAAAECHCAGRQASTLADGCWAARGE